MAAIQRKTGLGRQRIAMRKISKKSNLQVTFSKRRAGLFKKASELCTLCGVEIAVIVFSPAGKAFSFSHPNMDSIIDRFQIQPKDNYRHGNQITPFNYIHDELNMELTLLLNQLEAEKKFAESLDQIRKNGNRFWWRPPVSELGLHELEQLKVAMEMLKLKITEQANEILVESFRLNSYNVSGLTETH